MRSRNHFTFAEFAAAQRQFAVNCSYLAQMENLLSLPTPKRSTASQLCAKIAFVAAVLVSGCITASAAEMATLRNGFAIRHERHEVRGDVTRLYMAATPDNYVDIPTGEILGYEVIAAPVVATLEPPPVPASAPTLDAVVTAAGSHNNIDPDLILSVIRAESGFNPNAVSRKGAQGLMQLMPHTAAQMGVQDAFDPATNVEGGTRYLGQLLARYHNNLALALAAYNAGPDRVEQYRGVPPYRETRVYVTRIIQDFNRKKTAQRSPRADGPRSASANEKPKAFAPTSTSQADSASPASDSTQAGS